MQKPLIVLLVAGMTLSGCGFRDSGFNPLNWFGRGRAEPAATAGDSNPLIPRRRAFARPEAVYPGDAIAVIREMRVEKIPGGAIVHATGVSRRAGPYEAQLVRDAASEPGVMSFEFDVITPSRARVNTPEATRTVTVGAYVADDDLQGIGTIRVRGAENALASRRQ